MRNVLLFVLPAARNVPHGEVQLILYQWSTLGRVRRMHVYFPPGYDTSGQRYPPDTWIPNIEKFDHIGFTSNGLSDERLAFYDKTYPGVLDNPAKLLST